MNKILYIRLDSSPLPEESDEIIVKDFNLESYFCTLLGKRLQEEAGQAGTMLYPGKLLTDFEKFDKEAYREIIQQWEEILTALLISQSENDKNFKIKLPNSYVDWLDRCDIPKVSKIKEYCNNALGITLQRKCLLEIVNKVLKSKVAFLLQRNKASFNGIVFSIEGISRESYCGHLWKSFITRDYDLWTLKEFKRYCLFYIEPFRNNFEDCRPFSEGFAAVKRNKKWGFINSKMEIVINCQYDEVRPYKENMACVKKGGWGAIDMHGNVKISTIHGKSQEWFNDGRCAFNTFPHKYNYWSYYDKNGKQLRDVIPLIIDTCFFSEGLVVVKKDDGQYYILDKELNDVAKEYGLKWTTYSEGLIGYNSYSKGFGFLDNKGRSAIRPYYDEISYFSEGLCFVKRNGKWGVINKKGTVIIPFTYDSDYRDLHFSEGMAAVNLNGKWGYINKQGEIIVPIIYEDCRPFKNGFAFVKYSGHWGYINQIGKSITLFIYDSVKYGGDYFSEEYAAVRTIDDKYGYIDRSGRIIIPCIYDKAFPISNGIACVSLNGKYGYINKEWLKDL